MANIKLRGGSTGPTNTSGNNNTFTNSPLSYLDVDRNFINLNEGKLDKSLNLSDIGSPSVARSNLGLGSLSTQNNNDVAIIGGTVLLSSLVTIPNITGYIDLSSTKLRGSITQFNDALTGADFVSIAGTETLTNKTLISPIIDGTNGPAKIGSGTSAGIITSKNANNLILNTNNNSGSSSKIVINYGTGGDIELIPGSTGITHVQSDLSVDGSIQGRGIPKSVKCATVENITKSGLLTIDGQVLVSGDLVLVKDQSTASENGIYVVTAGSWTRYTLSDTAAEVTGTIVSVQRGTVNAGTIWFTDFKGANTVDSSSMNWYQLLPIGSNTATIKNYRLTSDGSSIGTSYSNPFGTKTVTLNANSVYKFKYDVLFYKTTNGKVYWQFTNTSNPVLMNWSILVLGDRYITGTGGGEAASIAALGENNANDHLYYYIAKDDGNVSCETFNESFTTDRQYIVTLEGTIITNAETTLTLNCKASAGTLTPYAGSILIFEKLPDSNL